MNNERYSIVLLQELSVNHKRLKVTMNDKTTKTLAHNTDVTTSVYAPSNIKKAAKRNQRDTECSVTLQHGRAEQVQEP
jgi:hypothetical protein